MQNDVAGGEGDECNNDVVGNGNGNANDNDIPSWYRFVVFWWMVIICDNNNNCNNKQTNQLRKLKRKNLISSSASVFCCCCVVFVAVLVVDAVGGVVVIQYRFVLQRESCCVVLCIMLHTWMRACHNATTFSHTKPRVSEKGKLKPPKPKKSVKWKKLRWGKSLSDTEHMYVYSKT